MDWSHIKKRGWRDTKGTLEPPGQKEREEDRKTAGEDRQLRKRGEAGMN